MHITVYIIIISRYQKTDIIYQELLIIDFSIESLQESGQISRLL